MLASRDERREVRAVDRHGLARRRVERRLGRVEVAEQVVGRAQQPQRVGQPAAARGLPGRPPAPRRRASRAVPAGTSTARAIARRDSNDHAVAGSMSSTETRSATSASRIASSPRPVIPNTQVPSSASCGCASKSSVSNAPSQRSRRHEIAGLERRDPVRRDELRRGRPVARGEVVVDRQLDRARARGPRRRRAVERDGHARLASLELGEEEVPEQLVIAERAAIATDRLDEQVLRRERLETVGGVGTPGDRLDRTRLEQLEDG